LRARGRWAAVVATLGFAIATVAPAAAGPPPEPQPPGPLPVFPAPPGFPIPAAPVFGVALAPPLDWLTAAKTAGSPVTAKQGATQQLAAARAAVRQAQKTLRAARAHLAEVREGIAAARHRIAQLDRSRAITLGRERDRAVRAYMGGDDAVLISDLLSASSINDQARRAIYANAGASVDARIVDEIEADLDRERGILVVLEGDERGAARALVVANDGLTEADKNVLMLTAVADDASHGGRVFPVDGPFEFDDSWGAFRADVAVDTGSHGHDATDIMAAAGTPVVAIESGTLDRVGWNELGGWRLWIKGVSGTSYYYAHLSAYGPNLMEGVPVLAGQYLGLVGNTGNARGGPAHLHFEVHLPDIPASTPPPATGRVPGSEGVVVNPYPLLCLLAGAPVPAIPPSDPSPPLVPSPTTSTVSPGSRGT
jgi:murein DD-endopeptidase MepM/ murein hydrolase activator NlpD